jgi:alpha-tubulin suppressor-like RCC1 family protein
VQCWGGNDVGELGDGTTTSHSFPEPVTGISGAIMVVAGFNHTCALVRGSGVMCWGANGYGQLGDGTTTDNAVPVAVTALPPR